MINLRKDVVDIKICIMNVLHAQIKTGGADVAHTSKLNSKKLTGEVLVIFNIFLIVNKFHVLRQTSSECIYKQVLCVHQSLKYPPILCH